MTIEFKILSSQPTYVNLSEESIIDIEDPEITGPTLPGEEEDENKPIEPIIKRQNLEFTMESNVLASTATSSFECKKTATTGTITIKEFYASIKYSSEDIEDVLRITFDNNSFYDFYGGYLPSGKLGTCRLRSYVSTEISIKEINGMVYFYNGALNVIPNDINYPKFKYWHTADKGIMQKIGIVSMTIEFEIQSSQPTYEDLSQQ